MTSTTPIRPVRPEEFDRDLETGVAGELHRVVAAAAAADGRSPLNEATLLALRHRGLDGASLWVAGDPVTDLVGGFLLMIGDEVNLVVAPESRRRGLGRALAEHLPTGHRLTAWSHGNHPGAAALARDTGFERVRDLWVMRHRLDQPLPPVTTPAGIDVRTFEPGRDEDAWLTLNAAAFAHHPEQGATTRADLEQRMAEPWFDPAGFFLAERTSDGEGAGGRELVGFHWTKVHDEQPPYGEVYVVGVSPTAQGMGLGKLLTLVGLHHLADRGLGEVVLYVEADNAPAIAVYSRLGFTHADADTDVMYARER